MSDLNCFAFTGRLTRDPELTYSSDGKPRAKYGVAINEKWGGKDKVHFVDCITFGKFAETLAEHLKKGSQIAGRGKLDYSTWEKDSVKRSKLGAIVMDVTFLGKKNETE